MRVKISPFKYNEGSCDVLKHKTYKNLFTEYLNVSRMFYPLLNQLIAFDDRRTHVNRVPRVFSTMPEDFRSSDAMLV